MNPKSGTLYYYHYAIKKKAKRNTEQEDILVEYIKPESRSQ